MVGRVLLEVIVVVFLVLLLAEGVSANFVCGFVDDSKLDFEASWLGVDIFYIDNPSFRTNCQVSPEGMKFCCDPSEIEEVSWAIGKEVGAEIINEENGLVSEVVSLTISGEGYDIFPDLVVNEVSNILSPNKSFIFPGENLDLSFETFVLVDSVSYEIMVSDGISWELYDSGSICEECSYGDISLGNLDQGFYRLDLISNYKGIEFHNYKTFSVIGDLNFDRSFECLYCAEGYAKSGELVSVSLSYDFSGYSEGKAYDLVPVEWEIIDSPGGYVEPYNEDYNIITWNINGSSNVLNYYLKTPFVLFTTNYEFIAGFENQMFEPDDLSAFFFYRFLSWPRQGKYGDVFVKGTLKRFLDISPENPIVLSPNTENFLRVGIFPDEKKHRVYAYSFFDERDLDDVGLENAYLGFFSSLSREEIDNVIVEFKIPKVNGSRIDSDISIYHFGWIELDKELYLSDENYDYYRAKSPFLGNFRVSYDLNEEILEDG